MFGSAPAWLVLVEVTLFTLGATAFAVVFLIGRSAAWRDTPAGFKNPAGTAIALNSLFYCTINVAIGLVTLHGERHGLGLLTAFTITTYLFPPLIVADTLAGDSRRAPVRGGVFAVAHAVVWAGSLAGIVFVAGLFFGWWRPQVSGAFFNLTIGTLFLIAVVVALAVERRRRRAGTAQPTRPEARWVFRLFAVTAGLAVLLMASGGDLRSASYALSLTTRLLPIAFLVAGAWADGRAAFYDLLVKRMTLTVLAVAALAAASAAVRPLVVGLDPWRAAWIAGLLLAPLVVALLGVGRVISDWLDTRWLGRRYSSEEAIELLLAATRGTDDRAEVERQGLAVISRLFDATATLVRAGADAPAMARSVARAPVDADTSLEVRRRDESRRLYSEDLALVRSVARVLGLEFARVALEHQRRAEAARALRAQINPHFLFNALNTIGGWVQADPARAEGIVEQLAEVFRYTLRGTTSEWVTLDAELSAVERYLAVERARFGDRLSVNVTRGDGVGDALVPPLIVLTLAENAVKHGVAPAVAPVRVSVEADHEDGTLRVAVVDTGEGLDANWAGTNGRRDGGFGLSSVRERLRLLCGGAASLEGTRDDAGGETRFTVRLPLRHASPSDEPWRPATIASRHR